MSESDKTFSFMHVANFDFTLVTVAMVTGKEYGLDSCCTFIQTVVCHGTKISVFGTNTSENPRFTIPISVPKQNTKTC